MDTHLLTGTRVARRLAWQISLSCHLLSTPSLTHTVFSTNVRDFLNSKTASFAGVSAHKMLFLSLIERPFDNELVERTDATDCSPIDFNASLIQAK